jgi:predicted nucleic-acid-binding protein
MILDTNVLIRHLTGDPPDQAEIATDFMATARSVLIPDVVVAECVFVLESYYGVERWRIAEMMRSALETVTPLAYDPAMYRYLELYETVNVGFVDAYLLAQAEYGNWGPVVTFDRDLKRRAESHEVVLLGE